MAEKSQLAKIIKIIAIPQGEAEQWVRRCWVGCVFPCLPESGRQLMPVQGAVSGERVGSTAGFNVLQETALQVLALRFPTAAAWWREHGFPQNEQYFRFRAEECEVLEHLSRDEALEFVGRLQAWDDLDHMWMPDVF